MQFDPKRSDFTLGIIGTGAMGRGIAQVATTGGMRVLMSDARAGARGEAKAFVAKMLERAVEKGSMSKEAHAAAMGRHRGGRRPCRYGALPSGDRGDRRGSGGEAGLFAELEGIVGEDCILATNTSSLAVTTIAAKLKRPERFAGMHFFNPVPLMKLVEVIDGVRTAPEVGDALMEVGRRMGREPVRSRMRRVSSSTRSGAASASKRRISRRRHCGFVDIDRIMRDVAGFRMGPFELMELTGLDVSQPASVAIYEQCYHEPRYRPAQLMRSRYDAGIFGRKTNKGFYDYAEGKAVVPAEPPARLPRGRRASGSASRADGHAALTALLKDAERAAGKRRHTQRACADPGDAPTATMRPPARWSRRSMRSARWPWTRSFPWSSGAPS